MQFKDIVGQKDTKHDLIQSFKSDKISHAQLFLGKPGYGTLALALAYSQYIFCENKSDDDSCGVCISCKQISESQHPDLHFVFPVVQAISKISSALLPEWRIQLKESSYFDLFHWVNIMDSKERSPIISTEESKEIIKKISLKSFQGSYKIMIIWNAEEMNMDCSNKILKILEEPPPKTLFLLICEDQQKLLPTIQSRTQVMQVPRIGINELSQHLAHHHNIDATSAGTIAAFSEGDYITALDLIKEEAGDSSYREQFVSLMRVSYKKDVIGMLDWAECISSTTKERQKLFILYALHMLRQSLVNNYIGSESLHISTEEAAFITNFSPYISGNNIQSFLKTFDDAHYHIERNANAKILFTQMSFQTMRYIHQA